MSNYPRITEIPAGGDLCWFADDSEDNDIWCDTLAQLIRRWRNRDMALIAGSSVFVADRDRPTVAQFMPGADELIDDMQAAADDNAGHDDAAAGWTHVEAAARDELSALIMVWAEKHLPKPSWWTNRNIREYVITQHDIDGSRS